MTAPNRATLWARTLVDELVRAGVRDICLAPGSRSTPLVLAAAALDEVRLRVFLDERSAAFFALGSGKATGRPAAVVTTSGTAVANLFPAVVEAAQSETPLLLLTADRPPRLRDADANQAIDQVRIFGAYVRLHADAGPPSPDEASLRHLRALAGRAIAAAVGLPAGPVHLNLPFDKPLEPTPVHGDVPEGLEDTLAGAGRSERRAWTHVGPRRPRASDDEIGALAAALEASACAVLVAGPHPEAGTLGPALRRAATTAGVPLLADPLSGGRFGPGGEAVGVSTYDLALRAPPVRDALRPDLILRVGRAPTSASLLAWLERHDDVSQMVVDPGDRWKDHVARASHYVRADPVDLLARLAVRLTESPGPTTDRAPWLARWLRVERAARAALERPEARRDHEGVVLRAVVEALPENVPLFVSSSMPVRDLDAFGGGGPRELAVHGNRGASGIDGIVSTALGVAAGADRPVVCVLGDLALLHDVNGLLATREADARVVFVVVNNDGGGIFHMLPVREQEPEFTRYFATPHGVEPARAAALYGVPHRLVASAAELGDALGEVLDGALDGAMAGSGSAVLEIRTDREANRLGHEAAVAAVADAVAEALAAPLAEEPKPGRES